jgi:hypothetical protein
VRWPGLMLLAGRRDEVTAEDWRLAGHVTDVSAATRGHVEAVLEKENERDNIKRGTAEGQRAVIVAETVEAAARRRVCRWSSGSSVAMSKA